MELMECAYEDDDSYDDDDDEDDERDYRKLDMLLSGFPTEFNDDASGGGGKSSVVSVLETDRGTYLLDQDSDDEYEDMEELD